MQVLCGGSRWPDPLRFSPDGRYLTAGTDPLFDDAPRFRVWDLNTGGEPVTDASSEYYPVLAFGPDPQHLVVTQKWSVGLLEWQNGPNGRFSADRHLTRFFPVAVTTDGRFALASTTNSDSNAETGRLTIRVARYEGGKWANAWKRELRFSPDVERCGYSHLLFSISGRFVVRVHIVDDETRADARTEVQLFDTMTSKPIVLGRAAPAWRGFLPRRPGLATAGPTGVLALVKGRSLYAIDPTKAGTPVVKRTNTTTKHFTDLAFSPAGTKLATVSRDKAVTLWDTTTWEVVRQYEWKIGALRSVCFAPDGLRCAAGSDTGQIVVWDLDE